MTTGIAPKPIARNVAISVARVLTAEYIVLSAPNSAPIAMMPPTVLATISSSAETCFDLSVVVVGLALDVDLQRRIVFSACLNGSNAAGDSSVTVAALNTVRCAADISVVGLGQHFGIVDVAAAFKQSDDIQSPL